MKIIALVLFAGLLLAANADLNSTEFEMTNVTIAENETAVDTLVEDTNSTEVIEVVDEEHSNETDTISDVWSNETAYDN